MKTIETIDTMQLANVTGGTWEGFKRGALNLGKATLNGVVNTANGINGTEVQAGKLGTFSIKFPGEIEKPFKDDPLAKFRNEK